jgi:hypothetical protein
MKCILLILNLTFFVLFQCQGGQLDLRMSGPASNEQLLLETQLSLPGTMLQSGHHTEGRGFDTQVLLSGAVVLNETAPDQFLPSSPEEAVPPLSSLLTFSQYVTSRL